MQTLIKARAPLDHGNNLGRTAPIESIVLGDAGQRHTATLKQLIGARANVNLPERNGQSPLALARGRVYVAMVKLRALAGGK